MSDVHKHQSEHHQVCWNKETNSGDQSFKSGWCSKAATSYCQLCLSFHFYKIMQRSSVGVKPGHNRVVGSWSHRWSQVVVYEVPPEVDHQGERSSPRGTVGDFDELLPDLSSSHWSPRRKFSLSHVVMAVFERRCSSPTLSWFLIPQVASLSSV